MASCANIKMTGVETGEQAAWVFEQCAWWVRQHDPIPRATCGAAKGKWGLSMSRTKHGITAHFQVNP
jgi:hypothetical protein